MILVILECRIRVCYKTFGQIRKRVLACRALHVLHFVHSYVVITPSLVVLMRQALCRYSAKRMSELTDTEDLTNVFQRGLLWVSASWSL